MQAKVLYMTCFAPDDLNSALVVGPALVTTPVELVGSYDSSIEWASAILLNVVAKVVSAAGGTSVGVDSTDDSDSSCYGGTGWPPDGTWVLLMPGMPPCLPIYGYA